MSWSKYKALGALDKLSVVSGITGLALGGLQAYFGAKTERYKTKSLALNLEHQRDMTLFNKRQVESQAEWIQRVFNRQYQAKTLEQGNRESTARTSFAARGIQMGVGSTRDVFVSSKTLATIDRLTMNSNKIRARENKKLEAVGLGIKSDMLGVSASAMWSTASSIDPFMNMTSTLISGTSNLLNNLPESFLAKDNTYKSDDKKEEKR
tara:strand:- start:983 stop:1606 length:624 start_codon:yes stop_codon:yes gene_type:complete